ncbi:8-amino-7-oxononanoate synthase [Phytomonospora endophytica]|uniref:8-amino-7-oxononanoate synthase n=1 Tax=Phytomonospora endophytica TaxID=714109 RepID=A0A841FSL0_9ACTN|nr:8-amino-7-oxononanoate synthase [Phytomonospora endophytica]MBB6034960.1 8-amino-7-oxononanoate synthase [Phytomonospora endophytica]GIG70662.1 8-amino-7-oxononanoate synthase [Phytomonospora endophytica]
MTSWWDVLDRKAALRAKAGLTRSLVARSPGDALVDLAGNDYLGLSRHPAVLSAARDALDAYGLGATGSRLVRGSTEAHEALEERLGAVLGGAEGRGLVYSSGYLANLGAVRALCRTGTLLIRDAHAHASLVDGCGLAGIVPEVLPHSDPAALSAILAAHPGRHAVVLVESVYSVDGDLAPLAELHEVTSAHGAILLVDEAHALGVIGPGGAGGVAAAGLTGAPGLAVTATLSKALGAAGGIVAGPPSLRRHLVDTGRTFIFDTALPPSVAAGAHAALEIALTDTRLRAEVTDRSAHAASALGVPAPAAGVLSVPAPGAAEAVGWAAACRANGVAVGCFRPPSTPDSTSRLRLTVNTGVDRADFERAVKTIAEARP